MTVATDRGVRRLISGMRPGGSLHLGHHVGALEQWLSYQDEYECFFMIADVQALATHLQEPQVIRESVPEVALDFLAAGLDPQKGSIFVQSQIPEFAELTVYLQLLARTGELRGNPTVREEARARGQGDAPDWNELDLGFFAYPVSQVADMLLFTPSPPRSGDSLIVPVGEAQLPHVAFAREIARRFNSHYGPVFLEPEAKTTPSGRLRGTDGGFKMGKSRGNAIFLNESPGDVAAKVRDMFTDPLRVHHGDLGHPDECLCYHFRQVFGAGGRDLDQAFESCLLGRADCRDCKEELAREIQEFLAPIQERRAGLASQPGLLEEILTSGTRRAREVARRTMERVREAMHLTYAGLIREEA